MNTLCDLQEQRSGRTRLQLGTSTIAAPHLNEGGTTEMVGDRMALYEQLTISSHMFANFHEKYRTASNPRMEHSMITANQYLSPPPSLSFLPPSDNAQNSTCQFFGTVQRNVVCEKNANDAARCLTAANDIFSKSKAASAAENLECTMQNTSKEILGLLTPKELCKDEEEIISVVARQDIHSANLLMLVKGAECLSIGDGLHRVSTSKSKVVFNQSAEKDYKKALSMISLQPNAATQNESHAEQQCAKDRKLSGTGQPHDKSALLDGLTDVQAHQEGCQGKSCLRAKDGNHATVLRGATVHANLQEKSCTCGNVDLEVTLASQHTEASKTSKENDFSISDLKIGDNADNTTLRMDCMTRRGLSVGRSTKCELPEQALNDIQLTQNVDDSKADFSSPISPKSVIQAVGQLRFWKARLALLRQQQIFSDQVFELHKLIEVQRLIAGTPYVPMNEMYFGVGNMITDTDNYDSPNDFIEIAEVSVESLGHEISPTKEGCKGQLVVKDESSRLPEGQSNCPSSKAILGNELNQSRVQTSIRPVSAQGFTKPWSADGSPVAAAAPGYGAPAVGFPLRPSRLSSPQTSMQSGHGSVIVSLHRQSHSSGCKVSEQAPLGALKKQYASEGPIASTMVNNVPDISIHQIQTGPSNWVNSSEPQMCNKDHFCRKNDDKGRCQADNARNSPIDSMVKDPDNRNPCCMSNEQGSMASVDSHKEPHVYSSNNEIRSLRKQKGKTKLDQPAEPATGQRVDGVLSGNPSMSPLNLFPLAPTMISDGGRKGRHSGDKEMQPQVVKAVPRAASSASESAAEILLSLQQERRC